MTSTIQSPSSAQRCSVINAHQENAALSKVNLNDKSRHSFRGSEDLRKFISSASVTDGGSRNSTNNMVRLVAQEGDEQQEAVKAMTPSHLFSNSSTSIHIDDHDDRFDVSLELPMLDSSTTLIWDSARSGDLSALQYAIESSKGSRAQLVNARDPETECTLLYTVVSSPNVKDPVPMMELLLDHGADATSQNVYNVQAIHAVALHCPAPRASIELLLKHEVDPNARDGDGWTPMHYVARFCKDPQEIIQLLDRYGANVNAVDVTQKSPLFPLLANGDHASALDWLIHSAKADVGIRGEFLDQQTRRTNPGTVLLQAAKYARRQCLAVLTNSAVAMETLKVAITQEELNQATLLLRQQLDKAQSDGSSTNNGSSRSSSSHNEKLEENLDVMLTMLEELRRTLEEDKTSTLAAEIHMECTGQQLAARRQSLLGSLRRKSRQQQQIIQQQMFQSPQIQRPPIAKTRTLSPRLLQDFASFSTASLGSLSSQTDKENDEASNVKRRTSLLRRVGNMLMRQKETAAISQQHQVA
ncbi:ankyrin repeat-containing domain protein [Zychaea mexicana]|uniref:ankyrin repeat-containing domain protein n=1 Tax=Zychaea mexicana TaxID=64656 RepID=UPI0022FE253B|nr:ankyrin repeat-containing domain protein [Zychaea mexicana]KAI9496393.1 ankyrin repeat-containing domain protein [Zychaea mexicana]